MRYFLLLFLFLAWPALAHPGTDFDENNCHVCVDDCQAWGLSLNEYHCHLPNGNYTNSAGQEFDSSGQMLSDSQSANFVPPSDEVPIDTYQQAPSIDNLGGDGDIKIIEDVNTNTIPTEIKTGENNSQRKIPIENDLSIDVSVNQNKTMPTNIIIYSIVVVLFLFGGFFLVKSFKK